MPNEPEQTKVAKDRAAAAVAEASDAAMSATSAAAAASADVRLLQTAVQDVNAQLARAQKTWQACQYTSCVRGWFCVLLAGSSPGYGTGGS
jgi:hypothetical protein